MSLRTRVKLATPEPPCGVPKKYDAFCGNFDVVIQALAFMSHDQHLAYILEDIAIAVTRGSYLLKHHSAQAMTDENDRNLLSESLE
jgi:hypothetical protein